MASVFLGLDDLKNTLSDALTVRWLRFDKERNHVKIQPNSVVDQAGDSLNDGGQDAEHNSAGNVRELSLFCFTIPVLESSILGSSDGLAGVVRVGHAA